MKANFYFYRNLRKNVFSVKYKGKVLDYIRPEDKAILFNTSFSISQPTIERIRQTKRKEVHAYITCEYYDNIVLDYPNFLYPTDIELIYNPYKYNEFMMLENNEVKKIEEFPKYLLIRNNKIYIMKEYE